MSMAADFFVALVAALHLYFMVLEMYFWTRPLGLKVFAQSREQAEASRVLAANQGLYNGFLSAGLVWGLWLGLEGQAVQIFFLGCVVVAGLFGAVTVNRKIFFVQALPAVIGMALVVLR